MLKWSKFYLGVFFIAVSCQGAYSYHDYRDDREANPMIFNRRIYLAQHKDYTQYPRRHYGFSSDVYYACPRGDFISDRPGRCPLDGSILVQRGLSHNNGELHYQEYH